MRLTLRTMLAYLDDVLDADDSAELGHKIEESEFATGLVARIRNSMNRPRLDSPPLEGRGMGHDPNTVAEYLDNTLPAERMPDFERVCLESDSHLAEAASCHQILTLVLGESAAVPTELRQRMYRMGAQVSGTSAPPVQPPPVEAQSVEPAAASKPSDSGALLDAPMPARKGRRNKPEVPDYIKTRSSLPLWPLALVLLLLVGVAGAAYMAFPEIGSFLAGGDSTDELAQKDTTENDSPDKGVAADDSNTGDEQDIAGGAAATTVDDEETDPAGSGGAVVDAGDSSTEETDVTNVDDPQTPPADLEEQATGGDEATDPEPTPPGDRLASNDPIGGGIPGVTEGSGAPQTDPAAELGRYTSESQVLLRYDAEEGVWWRMAPQTILSAGTTWLAPPSYRPQLTLASGLQLTMGGPTRITMLPPGPNDTPYVNLDFGTAEVVTIGRPNARLGLKLGDRQGELVFVDASSTCAIEVQRFLPQGLNPEEVEALVVSHIFCTRGNVTWIEEGQAPQELVAGNLIESIGSQPANMGPYLNVPAWVGGGNIAGPDSLGSVSLAPMLELDRPADLALQERANDRRAEVRALAARSLCYLGVFEPAIAALGDDGQRASWSGHFVALRDALTRGPETSAAVRTTLERKRAQDAEALYRMLWDYSQEDLEAGADAGLVAALDNQSLDMRVLAIQNLEQITGVSLLYRPEAPEANRRTPVARWRERLQAGSIRRGDVAAAAPAEAAPADTAPAAGSGEEATPPADPVDALPPAEAGAASVEG